MADIPIEILREHMRCDPETGQLFWKKKKVGRTMGKPLGRKHKKKYLYFGFEKKTYLAHRVIFALCHGYYPKEVDHINRNPQDNRITNLRPVSRSQNNRNGKVRRNNSSGHTGVSIQYTRKDGTSKWRAYMRVNKKFRWLGYYDKLEDAITARKKAEKDFYNV